MTTAPYEVEVECPKCGTVFRDWLRDSVNLMLERDMTDDEVEEQLSVTCPRCGHREYGLGLIVDDGGSR